jgi:hypothetical protein
VVGQGQAIFNGGLDFLTLARWELWQIAGYRCAFLPSGARMSRQRPGEALSVEPLAELSALTVRVPHDGTPLAVAAHNHQRLGGSAAYECADRGGSGHQSP